MPRRKQKRQQECQTLRTEIEILTQQENNNRKKDNAGYKKALPLCERLLTLSPQSPVNITLYIEVCAALGKTNNLDIDCQKLTTLKPNNPEYYSKAIKVLSALGKETEAYFLVTNKIQQLIKEKASQEVVYAACRQLIDCNPCNIAHYDKLIEILSTHGRETEIPTLMADKAKVLIQQGKTQEALLIFNDIATRFPWAPPHIQWKRERCLDQSLYELTQKIKSDPRNLEYYKQRATLSEQRGNTLMANTNRYLAHLIKEGLYTSRIALTKKRYYIEERISNIYNDHFVSYTSSLPYLLCLRSAVLGPESKEEVKKAFQQLNNMPLFRPILELAVLEQDLHFLSQAEYQKNTTLAQISYALSLVTFRHDATNGSAAHELCHLAAHRTDIIRNNNNKISDLRKKDQKHFTSLTSASTTAKDLYNLVITIPANRELYPSSGENEENIVRIAEAIALYGEETVKNTLPNLYGFFINTFLPTVRKTVKEREDELLKAFATAISRQVFVPQQGEVFGTQGKAVQKREAFRAKLTEQLLREKTLHHEHIHTLLYHYASDKSAQTIQHFIENLQNVLKEGGVFIHKTKKDDKNGNHYISIKPEKYNEGVVGTALEKSFSWRRKVTGSPPISARSNGHPVYC